MKCVRVWGTGASTASCFGSRPTTNHSLLYSQQGVRIWHESGHAGYTEYTNRYFMHVRVSVCGVMPDCTGFLCTYMYMSVCVSSF